MSDGEEWKGEDDPQPSGFFSMYVGREMTDAEKEAAAKARAEKLAQGRMRAALLVRFRADALCPKCGNAKASTAYCKSGNDGGWYDCLQHVGDMEHLHRTCKRCSFVWYELTLDNEDHA